MDYNKYCELFNDGGLSGKEFCKQNGLKYYTFMAYKNRNYNKYTAHKELRNEIPLNKEEKKYLRICKGGQEQFKKRNVDIMQAVLCGKSYEEVGKKYGLSRQRVHQIVKVGMRKVNKYREMKGAPL